MHQNMFSSVNTIKWRHVTCALRRNAVYGEDLKAQATRIFYLISGSKAGRKTLTNVNQCMLTT